MNKLATFVMVIMAVLTVVPAAGATAPDVVPLDSDGKPLPYVHHRRPRPDERHANPRILKLLHANDTYRRRPVSEIIMAYAHEFVGTPYAHKTLDRTPDKEQLVVDTDGMDCTTFVGYVLALALTARDGSDHYSDFANHLRHLRYDGGIVEYVARNHYFSGWVVNNERYVDEVCAHGGDKRGAFYPYVAKQVLNINYMTTHRSQYPQFASHPEFVEGIKHVEDFLTGREVRYIPKRLLGLSQAELGICDGDILAIVTSKKGLDVSHLGFAEWGSDGKLHLLNASSIHKKVVHEPMTLKQYMDKSASRLGVRVIRVRQ